MTEFNYGDVIEYIDGTFDDNFNEASEWAKLHGTTFEEDLSKRNLPKRYFVIGPEPEQPTPPLPPEPSEPTEEELKIMMRGQRGKYLQETDYTRLDDVPLTVEEKEQYRLYRVYLRDYTNQENWWLKNPLEFNEWLETRVI